MNKNLSKQVYFQICWNPRDPRGDPGGYPGSLGLRVIAYGLPRGLLWVVALRGSNCVGSSCGVSNCGPSLDGRGFTPSIKHGPHPSDASCSPGDPPRSLPTGVPPEVPQGLPPWIPEGVPEGYPREYTPGGAPFKVITPRVPWVNRGNPRVGSLEGFRLRVTAYGFDGYLVDAVQKPFKHKTIINNQAPPSIQ